MIEFLFAITLGVGSVILATISLGMASDRENGDIQIPKEDINELPERGDIKLGNSFYRYGKFEKDNITLFYIIKNPDRIEDSNQIKKEDYGVLKLDTQNEGYTGHIDTEFIQVIDALLEQKKSINLLDNK
ncbi:hypothetical protein GQ472_05715 [archaeon]|nr:hypothetical protein [archaeon]